MYIYHDVDVYQDSSLYALCWWSRSQWDQAIFTQACERWYPVRHIVIWFTVLFTYICILSILLFSMNYVQHNLGRSQQHMYNIVINAVPICTFKYRHFVRLIVTGSWFQVVTHDRITSVEIRTVSTLSREHTYKVVFTKCFAFDIILDRSRSTE